jgi:hypothetical protein
VGHERAARVPRFPRRPKLGTYRRMATGEKYVITPHRT